MGVKITGFAGLLILAVRQRVLSSEQALSLLDGALAQGMRLSDSLVRQVRDQLRA
uniref:DUF3368 domain-containing protein n=1 Tax=uncultured Thiotrichaceae bacterium TaxID=298394 RepID=A0A6S6U2X5_9GAMM|nr:MAG: Unknown protein [uncultured Thiotrichaceae bacterium]